MRLFLRGLRLMRIREETRVTVQWRLAMSKNRLFALVSAAFVILTVAGCEGPAAPSSPGAARGSEAFPQGGEPVALDSGNSAAALECNQGGYQNLFRTDGSGFANAGDCSSYAAQGGILARRVTASFTNVSFSACNALTWGYKLDGVSHDFESRGSGCQNFVRAADQTVTFLSTQTLRVFLRDDSCGGDEYLEGGSHSLVTGTNPSLIQITDSGFNCESDPSIPRPPVGRGNLDVTKTIS
jgi:hypothetical protein